MRLSAPLTLWVAFGCAGTDEPTTGDDSLLASPKPVGQCTEVYSVPGPFGVTLTEGIDPHDDVFGDVEFIDPDRRTGELGPDPIHVHLGWPGVDTSTSISFVWATDSGTLASQVQLGVGADLDPKDLTETLEGVSYRFGGRSSDAYRTHELKLCGRLTPSTTYSYRVGGEGHWSPVYTFTTPGAPGSFDSFVVAVAGDSRGTYEDWRQIVAAMDAADPDFYLFSGDMVDIGADQGQWYGWWEATDDVFAERVLVPTHGNHELMATNYFAQFSLPNNEQWFSVDYGNATIVSLNDTPIGDLDAIEFDQVGFIEDTLGSSKADWKIALHHRSTYSICDNHGSDEGLRAAWEGSFEATGVDLVFSGHNHIYERTQPIREGQAAALGDGIVYVVSGGAGAPLYTGIDPTIHPFNEVADPVEHFVLAAFGADGVQVTSTDVNGNVIDSFFVPGN